MLVVITMLASTALLSAQDPQTPLTKDQFMVATDLYFIDVNKL
jgi:hypothetical protein